MFLRSQFDISIMLRTVHSVSTIASFTSFFDTLPASLYNVLTRLIIADTIGETIGEARTNSVPPSILNLISLRGLVL